MNKQNRFNPGKRIWLAIALCSLAFLSLFYRAKNNRMASSPRTFITYSLLSHNVATIQNNPLEYTTTLRLVAYDGNDKHLQRAAKKLLAIDVSPEALKGSIPFMSLEKALVGILKLLYQHRGEKCSQKEAQRRVRSWFKKNFSITEAVSLEQLVEMPKGLGRLDKTMRQLGMNRFSPLFFNRDLVNAWMQYKGNLSILDFAEKWKKSMLPHLHDLYPQQMDEKGVRRIDQEVLSNFLFDIYVAKTIVDSQGASAWSYLVCTLQKKPLGNKQLKNQKLVAIYKEQNPDIICLQESDKSLTDLLCQEGYFIPPNANTAGSVILYKKETFEKAHITPLTFDLTDSKRVKQLSGRAKEGLTNSEAVVHQVEIDGMIWIIDSFHAVSDGENSEAHLEVVFALKDRLEKKHAKKVLLLVAMDGNTTQQTAIAGDQKKSLQEIQNFVKEQSNDFTFVKHVGEDLGTVRKERSIFQVQTKKTHVEFSGISDFILVSKQVSCNGKRLIWKQRAAYMSSYGPNLTDNPSDHRAIGVTFSLET